MIWYPMLCYAMLWDLKTPPYADEFQTFQSKIEVKVYHLSAMWSVILFNKSILNRVKIKLYAMLWYTVVWYDEIYAIVWGIHRLVWISYATLYDFNAML